MRRISLFATVFVVPALIAIVLATWAHRSRARRSEALDMFGRALAEGQALPVDRIVNHLGMPAAATLLEKASESDLIEFDGRNRVAQIEKDGLRYPNGTLDQLFLYTIGDGIHLAIQQPPVGTVIDSVAFEKDGLAVTLHGKLLDDGTVTVIPAAAPELYHIPWTANTSPSSPTLTSMIRSRAR